MKEKITSLVLVLVVAMSMTVGASAASYIPDDVTYQNLNGQQLAIKTYTLLPDQDPADLYEEDFEHDGFLYSMSDIIKEEQAKLGFFKEDIRLYYPLSSLNAMLEMQETDIRELAKKIRHELEAKKEKMGDTQIRIHADRIVFTIPPDFVEYVHEQVPEPPFLKELIQLFREKHACTKEEITAVFEKFGAYECRQMPDGMDFDYVIYFTDSSIDAYDYCIREEMGHTIYHRFARADFEALMTIQ